MRNIAVLTADEHRHRYFANYLLKRLNVNLVISETKAKRPQNVGKSKSETDLLTEYFNARQESEKTFFPKEKAFNAQENERFIQVSAGEINSNHVLNKLHSAKVDTLAVFGTSLLKSPIIRKFSGNIFNIHLGVSPYYRGSATNFWALYNEDFNMVGATIHYLNEGIDSGPIICHIGTNYHEKDTPHDIGNMVIMNSVQKLCDILLQFDNKDYGPHAISQWSPDKTHYYRRKDFNAEILRDFLSRWKHILIKARMNENNGNNTDHLITLDSSAE